MMLCVCFALWFVAQCEKFGEVETIFVDQTSHGDVWVKFANKNVNAARDAIGVLNGKLFAGRTVTANYTPEKIFNANTIPNTN